MDPEVVRPVPDSEERQSEPRVASGPSEWYAGCCGCGVGSSGLGNSRDEMRLMRRVSDMAFVLALAAIGLAGCYYVVQAAPPPPGVPLVVPEFVRDRPQCRWSYGMGWHGWAWYSSVPC